MRFMGTAPQPINFLKKEETQPRSVAGYIRWKRYSLFAIVNHDSMDKTDYHESNHSIVNMKSNVKFTAFYGKEDF